MFYNEAISNINTQQNQSSKHMLKFINKKLFTFQTKNLTLRGFTLLELIVVIAIISILAVIIAPSFNSALRRARDAKRVTELKNIQTDLLIFSQTQNNGQYYPHHLWASTRSAIGSNGTPNNSRPQSSSDNIAPAPALISLYNELGKQAPQGVLNGEYKYVGLRCRTDFAAGNQAKSCQSFVLWTNLEDANSALDDDNDVNTPDLTSGVCGVDSTYSTCTGYIVPNNSTSGTRGVAGSGSEACTSKSTTATDCVFDLSPQ